MKSLKAQKASILVLTLWILSLLTVLALHIGLLVRQKIILLSRLEDREVLQQIAESGIKKGIAVFESVQNKDTSGNTAATKQMLQNNPDAFKAKRLGGGTFDVAYEQKGLDGKTFRRYGLQAEDAKLNINFASKDELERLFIETAELNQDEAAVLAEAAIGWREYGETEIVGFYSDDYYDNLEFPYPPKKNYFEILDEVKLIKGMNAKLFQKVQNDLTVYGKGPININDAGLPALLSLGFSHALADKVMNVRQGPDGVEATADDGIFVSLDDFLSVMTTRGNVSKEENEFLHQVVQQGRFKTVSDYYRIRGLAQLQKSREIKEIACVIDAQGRIVYWKE